MVEGTLDVHWVNKNDPSATPRYRVNFLVYGGASGAQRNKEFVGDEHLLNCNLQLCRMNSAQRVWRNGLNDQVFPESTQFPQAPSPDE